MAKPHLTRHAGKAGGYINVNAGAVHVVSRFASSWIGHDVISLSLKLLTGDVYIDSVFTHCQFQMPIKANVVRCPLRLAGVDVLIFS